MENTTRTYSIKPYDPQWPFEFEKIKKLLIEMFDENIVYIEHVGSTSVPGMKAKPLIDVLMVVKDIDDCKNQSEKITSLGYKMRENVLEDNSLLFEKFSGNEKVENIHVFTNGAPKINQFIDVRDYLRTHSERAEAYGNLKEKIQQEHPDDYFAYRPKKADFLKETVRLATEWKNNQ